jgi:SAM-dependent methyltransferase
MGGMRTPIPPSDSTATRWPVALLLVLTALSASAQNQPYVKKMAPYVASPIKVIDRMLDLASIRPGETVFDLGCGDGRILIAAVEKYQAKAIGVEISPKLAAEARAHIKKAGLTDKAQVIEGDLLEADLTGADVVVIYLTTSLNQELRPRFEKFLKPGARVISHDYAVPGWKPTQVVQADGRQKHAIYLYEMPPVRQ